MNALRASSSACQICVMRYYRELGHIKLRSYDLHDLDQALDMTAEVLTFQLAEMTCRGQSTAMWLQHPGRAGRHTVL